MLLKRRLLARRSPWHPSVQLRNKDVQICLLLAQFSSRGGVRSGEGGPQQVGVRLRTKKSKRFFTKKKTAPRHLAQATVCPT